MSDNSKNNDHDNLPEKGAENEWMELFKTAFWAVLLAMTIRALVFEPFNIPSGSMKPSLLVGDYLFVSKYSYGYSRYSFPFGIVPLDGRVWNDGKDPQQGDVVVFKLPTDNRTDYIKRVVGMPGDTVQVRDGRLFINGIMVKREQIDTYDVSDRYGNVTHMYEYWETLPNGVRHKIYEEGDNGPLDNTRIFTVPSGEYFVMGDNRDNSQDSRVSNMVGTVPLKNFLGRADLIFFSTNGSAHLWEFWKWPWTVRYDRLFDRIK